MTRLDTAAQTLAAILMPIIAVACDQQEIIEHIDEIARYDIGGKDAGTLASELSIALDGYAIRADIQCALWMADLLEHEDGPAELIGYAAAFDRAVLS